MSFRCLCAFLCMLDVSVCVSASAIDVNGQLDSPSLQTRFEDITKQLRCLVCQNESIADSNVQFASDLRRQVQEMLITGESDEAIYKLMNDRFGHFVRSSPPLRAKKMPIWGAPFIAVLIGVVTVVRVGRRRSKTPRDDDTAWQS